MKIVVQRSLNSSVSVDNKVVGKIDKGLVLLVGFTNGDDESLFNKMIDKVINLRIFEDENGVMNKSILDYGGEILSISQFTLYANTKKGNRPSYIEAMRPEEATKLYDLFNKKISAIIPTKFGVFGADMLVTINNVGPTTIMLEK